MVRTSNRTAFSVATPSSNEAKDYFFNHSNWKGMSDDKNFLTADQETFESCNNVYVDSEGLLRSRPAIKRVDETVIVNFWTLGTIVIALGKTSNVRYDLYISDTARQMNASTVGTEFYYTSEKVKPIQMEDKIFVFAEDSLRYIDSKTLQIADAEPLLYVPETTLYTSDTGKQEAESKNLLTDNVIFTYLYDASLTGQQLGFIIGKQVSFTMIGRTFTITFGALTPLTLLRKLPIIRPQGQIIAAVFPREGYDSIAIVNIPQRQFLYSLNGITWNIIKEIPNDPSYNTKIVSAQFTKDGNEFIVGRAEMDSYTVSHKYYIVSVNKSLLSGDLFAYRFPEFVDYSSVLTFPATASELDMHSWNYGVVRFLTDATNPPYLPYHFRVYVSDDKFYDAQPASWPTYDGTLVIFRTAGTGLHSGIVALSQGVHGRFCYYMFDDEFLYTHSSWLDLAANDLGAVGFKDKVNVVNQNVIVTCWRQNVLTQYIISGLISGGSYSWHVLNEYSEQKAVDFYVNADASQIMTRNKIYKDGMSTSLLISPSLVFDGGTYFYSTYGSIGSEEQYDIYSNDVTTMTFKEFVSGSNDRLHSFLSELFSGDVISAELDETYLSVNDQLIISSKRYDDDGNLLLYFPDVNKQRFTSKVTGLQAISSDEMAVFLPHEIWYCKITDSGYTYTKSKLQVGLKSGSDIITAYDGTQVIFPSERGLVALTYQNFVATTDQSLVFLSDVIHADFDTFIVDPVKLLRYQYWILCYKTNSKQLYVFDMRNGSWWPMEAFANVTCVKDVNNHIISLLDGHVHKLNCSDDAYYDESDGNSLIDWHITSQKLHFGAINYTKHIANITLMSVLDSDKDTSFKLKINNYRKRMNTTDVQTSEYKVDVIRTYVKRVSFPKVHEFQYTMYSDDEQSIRVPLSLSGLTIKYRIGSQVR